MRRGSKANEGGAKLRSIDIRMAVAAAMHSQAAADAPAAPGPPPPAPTSIGRRSVRRWSATGGGPEALAARPAAAALPVVSPFKSAEGPYEGGADQGARPWARPAAVRESLSSPAALGDARPARPAGCRRSSTDSARYFRPAASQAQVVREAEEAADKELDVLMADLNCLIDETSRP